MRAWWLNAIGALITGFCYGLSKCLRWKGYRLPPRVTYYIDGIAYYFLSLVVVLLVRSFIVEWAIVPSDSFKPTLLPGDRVATDKAAYGIRLPITGHLLAPFHLPQRGDVVVLRSPKDFSSSLVKRIVGIPGDRVQYINKKLIINNYNVPQVKIGLVEDDEKEGETWELYQEELDGHVYRIYRSPPSAASPQGDVPMHQPIDVVVPKGHYFVIGDHRDQSTDSRTWGCLSDRYLLGKAKRIYLSRDKKVAWWKPHRWFRWERFAMRVK